MYYTRSLNIKNDTNYETVTDLKDDTTLTKIKSNAFYNWNITSLTIPDNVTTISSNAFTGATGIKYLEISKFYGDGCINYLFGGNTYSNLKEVKVNTVTSIVANAFKNYSSITKITIPLTTTSIGDSSFYGCASLINIDIPSGVTSIATNAFYGCSSLTEVVVPDSVTTIGQGAFQGCSSLTKITLPFVGDNRTDNSSSTTRSDHYSDVFGYIFGYHVYENYQSTSSSSARTTGTAGESIETLQYDEESWSYSSYYYYRWRVYYYIPRTLREVVITDATSIPMNSFYNCSFLTSITINEGVTKIGTNAFYNCNAEVIYN